MTSTSSTTSAAARNRDGPLAHGRAFLRRPHDDDAEREDRQHDGHERDVDRLEPRAERGRCRRRGCGAPRAAPAEFEPARRGSAGSRLAARGSSAASCRRCAPPAARRKRCSVCVSSASSRSSVARNSRSARRRSSSTVVNGRVYVARLRRPISAALPERLSSALMTKSPLFANAVTSRCPKKFCACTQSRSLKMSTSPTSTRLRVLGRR